MPFFTLTDGAELHYLEAGSGETVVFLHGWACHSEFFKYQIEALSPHYHVLALDLRAHGRSEAGEAPLCVETFADDLKAFLDGLDVKSCYVVAWSMAVHVLLEYRRRYGEERMKKWVLIDMSPKPIRNRGEEWPYIMHPNMKRMCRLCKAPGVLPLMKLFRKPGGTSLFKKMFGKGADRSDLPWCIDQIQLADPRVMFPPLDSFTHKDYREDLPSIKIPTLVVEGDKKALFDPGNGYYMASHIPGATKLTLRGGHLCFMQDHERFNEALLAFLE